MPFLLSPTQGWGSVTPTTVPFYTLARWSTLMRFGSLGTGAVVGCFLRDPAGKPTVTTAPSSRSAPIIAGRQQAGEAVPGRASLGVVGAQGFLLGGENSSILGFGRVEVAASLQHVGQVAP